MTSYHVTLPATEGTTLDTIVQVGERSVSFHFYHNAFVEEQEASIKSILRRLAAADPLDDGTTVEREYDPIQWISLTADQVTSVPHSTKSGVKALERYVSTVKELAEVKDVYDCLKGWWFYATLDTGEFTVGRVISNATYLTHTPVQFTFVASANLEDLGQVEVQFDVI